MGELTDAQRKAIEAAQARIDQRPAQDVPSVFSTEGPPVAPQTTISDAVKDALLSARSGAVQGLTGAVDFPSKFPGYVSQAALWGAEKLGVMDPEKAQGLREMSRELLAETGTSALAEKYAPDVMGYQPETTLGEYMQTGTSFVPGMMYGSTATQMLAAGLGSELGGQLTEGSPYEPLARVGGAVIGGQIPRMVTPFPADPERLKLAARLKDAGVKPTAGQTTGSTTLRAVEGSLAPTTQQLDDLTAAAMRTTGEKGQRALGPALKRAEENLVGEMARAASGLNVSLPYRVGAAVDDIVARYEADVPGASLVPRIAGVAGEIKAAASKPGALNVVPTEQLKAWRQSIGPHMTAKESATREAAHALTNIIDDAIDDALRAAGREGEIAALNQARQQYQNLMAVRLSVAGAGAEKAVGLTPVGPLRSATQRVAGARKYAIDEGTDLTGLARAAAGVLDTAPTTLPGGVRGVQNVIPAITSAIGGAGGYAATQNPMMAILGALGGAAVPMVAREAVKTPMLQAMLGNQIFAGAKGSISPALISALTNAQRN